MKMTIKSFVAFALVFLSTSLANSASFDCTHPKNLNETEALICSHPSLSKLDDELNESFQSNMKRAQFKKQLRQEQRVWVQERNHEYSLCKQTSEVGIDGEDYCPNQLEQKYGLRIKQLVNPFPAKNSCLSNQLESSGVFSGDWLFEEFTDGKRWMELISINQQGKKLIGARLSGSNGGRIDSGTITGEIKSNEALFEYCEALPNKKCFELKAIATDHELKLFRCRNTGECEKKPMSTLYQKSTTPCDSYPPKLK